MSIEHGQSGVNSYIGTFLTLVLITITGFYSYYKTSILLRRRDTDVFTYTSKEFFADKDRFAFENGFNVAVAFTSFGSSTEWQLDSTVGELRFRASEWGFDEDGNPKWNNDLILDSAVCTKEELGIGEDQTNAKFMPIVERSRHYMELYQEKFLCLK